MAAPQIVKLDWGAVEAAAEKLAQQLQQTKQIFNGIVAVTRGGLIPAAILARHLNIRWIETVGVQSYAGVEGAAQTQNALEILKHFASARADLLVVDDLVDTGETLALLRQHLPNAKYAVLYAKPAGVPQVDFYGMPAAQQEWLSFPWEISE